MGLFEALFGDGFLKHRERGDRHRAAGELGLAKAEYESALAGGRKRAEDELAPVRTALAEVRRGLAATNRARAGELRAAGLLDEAADALHFSLELTDDAEAGRLLRAELAELERERQAHDEAEEQAERLAAEGFSEGDEFTGHTFDERLEIFLGGVEDADIAEEYREMGEPFLAAVLLLQEGEVKQAVAAFEAQQAAGEDRPLLWLELGRARLLAGGAEAAAGAVELLQRWVELHPGDHAAATTLAEALRLAGRAEEATELLEQVADEAHPESPAMQHLAEHLVLLQRWPDVIDVCQEALRHRPRAAELKQLLGIALHQAGRSAEAAKMLEAVLRERWRVNPETGEVEFDRPTASTLIKIYLGADKLGQAERAVDLLLALERQAGPGELPELHLAMGQALLRLGRTDEARRRLETARALAGEEGELAGRIEQVLGPLRG